MIKVFHVAWLVAIWLALWSDVSWANLASGLVVAVVVALVYGTWRAGATMVRPVRVLKLILVFLVELVEASVVVARTVISPRGRIRSGIVAVPLSGCSDAVATLIAEMISLTPGTLTLEVRRDPLVLYVHVLHVRDVEAVRRDIHRLEVLAIEAFGDADALAGVHRDDSTAYEGTP